MAEKQARTGEDRINTPANIVTIIRVCLIPVFVVVLISPWPEFFSLGNIIDNHAKAIIATAIFALISCTDFIDGYLARSRNEVTTFGKFMDPLADKMLVIAALLALIELDVLPSWPVIIIIAREFIVSGVRMLAATRGEVIAASWWGKFKTTFQIIAIVLFLLKEGMSSTTSGDVFSDPLYLLAWVVMIIALVLTIVSMFDYIAGFLKMTGGAGGEDTVTEPLDCAVTEDTSTTLQQRSGPSTSSGSVSKFNQQLDEAAKALLDTLRAKNMKVITAESLTGGMICEVLTRIPGSSDVVLGGISSYAYELKRDALGVDYEALLNNGAVNDETAAQMVIGAKKYAGANCAVSVTGIAGPGGEEPGKPVGTVYMGILIDGMDEPETFRLNFEGTRDEVRKQTALAAITKLSEKLNI